MEVFLRQKKQQMSKRDILHTYGGVSKKMGVKGFRTLYSPYIWRCFSQAIAVLNFARIFSIHMEVFLIQASKAAHSSIFSIHMEVFLGSVVPSWCSIDILHTYGGVSGVLLLILLAQQYSPYIWRCFSAETAEARNDKIFSIHMEVFLKKSLFAFASSNILHTYGGVSNPLFFEVSQSKYSPYIWRCFYGAVWMLSGLTIFSIHMEVFLEIGVFKRY